MALRDVPPSLVVRQLFQPLHAGSLLAGVVSGVGQSLPALDFCCVYRRRNAARVTNLMACVPQAMVHLWALDEIDEQLASITVGTGPGTRIELLNRLCANASGEGSDRWLLITDDDIKMPRGQLRLFIRIAQIAALDVSQPAHLARSYHSWKINGQRLSSVARTTRYIEQGPLVLLSPRVDGLPAVPRVPRHGLGAGGALRHGGGIAAARHRRRGGHAAPDPGRDELRP